MTNSIKCEACGHERADKLHRCPKCQAAQPAKVDPATEAQIARAIEAMKAAGKQGVLAGLFGRFD